MNPVLRSLLITLVAGGAILGAVYIGTGGSPGLERPAVRFMKVYWSDGIDGVDSLMSASFRKDANRQEFKRLRGLYMRHLGDFAGVEEVVSEEIDPQGQGHIDIRFAFEKGKALARYLLRRERDAWRVHEFRLDMPRSSAPDADWAKPEAFSSRLAWHWSEGRAAPVWEQFAPKLQAHFPLAAFEERSKALLKENGAYKDRKTIALEEDGEEAAHVSIEITFEKGTRQVDLELAWEGGRWRISRFDVEGLR